MRIVVLSQWYTPEPDVKSHLLAKDLATRGHEVTSITGYPNYPEGMLHAGYRIRWRQWEVRDNVRILRVPLYPDHSRSTLKRVLNYASFAASAATIGTALVGPADVMWVYHPPLTTGLPAITIGGLRRVPFIYEIQDMWPETLAATGMVSSKRALNAVDVLAKQVYGQAAAITVISPGFKRNLISKGVNADKIHVVPNWADEDTYYPVDRDERLAQESGLEDRFNVVYAGNMGTAQALQNVIKSAVLLSDVRNLQFVFIGNGVEEDKLKRDVAAAGLGNVLFLGRKAPQQMPAYYALADVLLVHLKSDPLFAITIPSKTTAYMACGRPILAAVNGDAAELVQSAGAGLACQPEDPHALAAAIRELYAMSCDQREAMGNAGRQTFLCRYTRAVLVERYEALFAQVIQDHRKRQR